MAGIDKTYVNYQELLEAIDWAKSVGTQTLEDGTEFRPLSWIEDYNENPEPGRPEYVLWCTPQWLDRWLWLNCPLLFIRNRLVEQYQDDVSKFSEFKYPGTRILNPGKHYKFLDYPRSHGYRWLQSNGIRGHRVQYFLEVEDKDGTRLSLRGNTWSSDFNGMMPRGDYIHYHWYSNRSRLPGKKSIVRLLRSWNIPVGSKIIMWNSSYLGLDYVIRVSA